MADIVMLVVMSFLAGVVLDRASRTWRDSPLWFVALCLSALGPIAYLAWTLPE